MYKYQSKCKFRMLTSVGDKILEIRPKQIIESDTLLDNDYLVLVTKKPTKSNKVGRPRIKPIEEIKKNEESTK